MTYIPLLEHSRPRILMLDFQHKDVEKVKKAGFDARRGGTGLYDQGQFFFPFATQDVEILFANVQNGSFNENDRKASMSSVEESMVFKDLIREIWEKAGWIVLFISQGTSPQELKSIGIEDTGVISRDRHHMPESIRYPLYEYLVDNEVPEGERLTHLPPPNMPLFRGQSVYASEDEEAAILRKYIKPNSMPIITCISRSTISETIQDHSHPKIVVLGEINPVIWLIKDDSVDENIMALKIRKYVFVGKEGKDYIHNQGGILLLPDCGGNNVKIALSLTKEVFTQTSPHLFDIPQHFWLENYQPFTVTKLQEERDLIIENTERKVIWINDQIEEEIREYIWLTGLLISIGDEFAGFAAQALRFLGFEVEEVDNNLAIGERKREDYRIWDRTIGYFALGEAKTTGKGRGAAEDFITKTQAHQARYSKENKQMLPPALLVVNYAIELDPIHREGRFYKIEVASILEDSSITALSSVALFDLCQFVLSGSLSREQARKLITSGKPLIPSVRVEEMIDLDNASDIPF